MGDSSRLTTARSFPDLQFRLAVLSDAAEVSRVITKVWDETYGHTVPRSDVESYLADNLSEEDFAREIQKEDRRLVLAFATSPASSSTSNGELVGVAQLNLNSTIAGVTLPHPIEMQRLYVSSELHGSGVAVALVHQAEVQARKDGAESMWLGTWENAHRAIAFYRKCGFESVGIKDFPIGGEIHHDLIMQKKL